MSFFCSSRDTAARDVDLCLIAWDELDAHPGGSGSRILHVRFSVCGQSSSVPPDHSMREKTPVVALPASLSVWLVTVSEQKLNALSHLRLNSLDLGVAEVTEAALQLKVLGHGPQLINLHRDPGPSLLHLV